MQPRAHHVAALKHSQPLLSGRALRLPPGANNYLGLSNHPAVVQAAHEALRSHGFGMASVRFICGTQV
jgi:7-keto-8-aminopelargonate synthetase-like enzyme